MISFPLENIAPGDHQLQIRAWDVFNNSGNCTLDFKVVPVTSTNILSFGCYPNPILNQANFVFSVEGLTGVIDASIEVFTGIGEQVKSIKKSMNVQPNILNEIPWDGLNADGLTLHNGLYFCRLTVKNSMGEIQQKLLKIIKF
jgi:hypothetical protein